MSASKTLSTSAAACLLLFAGCSPSEVSPPAGQHAPHAAEAAASPPAADPERSTAAAIEDIRARYADVRSRRGAFREVERDVTGLSTEGGTLQAFFDGQALRLLTATVYGETGRADREFYYDDRGRPFFALERESRYGTPLGTVAGVRERRYYFSEGRLIRLLDGERQVSADDPEYAARAKTLLELSAQLAGRARQP